MAHSRSFLANQKARNATVGAENLLNIYISCWMVQHIIHTEHCELCSIFSSSAGARKNTSNEQNVREYYSIIF